MGLDRRSVEVRKVFLMSDIIRAHRRFERAAASPRDIYAGQPRCELGRDRDALRPGSEMRMRPAPASSSVESALRRLSEARTILGRP